MCQTTRGVSTHAAERVAQRAMQVSRRSASDGIGAAAHLPRLPTPAASRRTLFGSRDSLGTDASMSASVCVCEISNPVSGLSLSSSAHSSRTPESGGSRSSRLWDGRSSVSVVARLPTSTHHAAGACQDPGSRDALTARAIVGGHRWSRAEAAMGRRPDSATLPYPSR